ncbi:LuxR C-terminal-related transcriptional regulator [Streptomyces sp. NPDC048219]|uniref:LuxR C-terminal-related transcriptional regulator n=1 Tax=Streptomyces sp. NPDC048219 TaxID=3365517 RepID=UPI003710CFC5
MIPDQAQARLERALFTAADQLHIPISVRALKALATRALALYNPPPDLPKVCVQDLTEQQFAVLLALAAGEQLEETAARMWITKRTVREHRSKLFAKLGVSTPGEAVYRAEQLGLVEVDASGLPLPGQSKRAALR